MALNPNNYDHQRLLPRTLEDLLIGWVARLGGFLILTVTGVTWLALLSWSATDPSLSTSSNSQTMNLVGSTGAAVSDLLLQTLGLSAVFVLVCLMVWGLQLSLSARVDRFQVRAFLAVIAILAIAGGSSALPTAASWKFLHGYGGLLGDVSYNLAAGMFGQLQLAGSGILAGTLLFGCGFWALSCAIGLDRERLFQIVTPQRRGPSDAGQRPDETAPTMPSAAEPPQRHEVAEPHEITEHRLEPRFNLSNLNPAQARLIEFGSVGAPDPTAGEQHVSAAVPGLMDRIHDAVAGEAGKADPGEEAATPPEDESAAAMAERFAPGGGRRKAPRAAEAAAARPVGANAAAAQGAQPCGDMPRFLGPPKPRPKPVYRKPSLNDLAPGNTDPTLPAARLAELRTTADRLLNVLADFSVKGEIRDIRPGPVVTLFEFEPARGTKSARVIALADDVARSMSATSARIAVIPGRNAIGIELPNTERETVLLRELLETDAYRNNDARLPLAIGKGIAGEPVIADLARMPHLLVAGTTGSGKSVAINAMILSLLYRKAPGDCRFLMIDPKMLELSAYNGIPHQLAPVITEPQQAVLALQWAVGEMEERYKHMTELGVRSIDVFNNRVRHARRVGEPLVQKVHIGFDSVTGQARFEDKYLDLAPMPYIVIVVDEFADLMCVAGKEIEAAVQRLSQMARAAGIHMIMATQRPSVDVVTGTIKANFPTRIGFKVASKIDSRTILNEPGAEQLLGQGDMLLATGGAPMVRAHGPFVGDGEVEAVSSALKMQGTPAYAADLCALLDGVAQAGEGQEQGSGVEDLYEKAVALVLEDGRPSTSFLQRRLSIGYNRAAKLIERMESEGLISAADRSGKRKIVA